jgi:uncharacterized membrane protein
MVLLILGLILFLGAHLTPTAPGFHDSLVARFGLNVYKLGFTVVALIGLGLIIYGSILMRGSPTDPRLWSPPIWTRHLAIALMLAAFVLLAAANVPSHIRDWVGHPMLTAIVVWALAHLLANGDLLALLLFGAFLAFALYDRLSVALRGVALKPAATGFVGDAKAVAIGALLWALVLFKVHAWAGAPLL